MSDPYSSALALEAEANWEVEGVRRAVERYRAAAQHKDPSELPSGQALLRELVGPLTTRLLVLQEEMAARATAGGAVDPAAWPLQLLDAERMAVIVVALAMRPQQGGAAWPITLLAASIGAAVRAQIDFDTWQDQAQGVAPDEAADRYLRWVAAKCPANVARYWRRWRRQVMAQRAAPWPPSTTVAVGAALIGALVETAGHRFRVEHLAAEGKTTAHLVVTEATLQEMHNRETRAEVARPMLMPMIVPPREWRYE